MKKKKTNLIAQTYSSQRVAMDITFSQSVVSKSDVPGQQFRYTEYKLLIRLNPSEQETLSK